MSRSPEADGMKELLARVRKIEIRSRRFAQSELSGGYRTVFRGSGMEFEEVREYARGDDVRSIDWNVTARTGHLFIKKYREERELNVVILVDCSASQSFGSLASLKREMATELAALLAFSSLRNKDKAGLVLFTDRIEHTVMPARGRSQVLRIVRDLIAFRPQGRRTSLALALDYVGRLFRRRAIVILISDFIDTGFNQAMRIAARRHDLVPIVLRDPWENALPDLGLLAVEDPESGSVHWIDSAAGSTRTRYAALLEARNEELVKGFASLGLDYLFLTCGEHYIGPLVRFFRKRAKRY